MVHEEELEQQAVIAWSKYFEELKWMFAVPNGAFLGGTKIQRINQMGRMKKAGLKVGVADLFLPVAKDGKHGMYIEMKKSKGGNVSADQKEFLSDMASAGYHCIIAHGAKEAIDEITEYMGFRNKSAN